MSPEELAMLTSAAEERYGASRQSRQGTRQSQKKKRNFWLDQISTAGGILGGIGGSFIAPIVGTAGGAAAGGALGEAIENLIDPETGNWGNVGKEAVVSGILGGGPIKLLKGGAALATGKGVQAASQTAQTPLRRVAGEKLTGAADDLAVKQFRLTPTQLTNFQKKFGEDAGQIIRKYGFQNVDDIASKGIEPLQQQFDEAITGITGVTKDSLKKNLMTRINRLSSAGPSDTKAIGGQLKKEANTLLKGFGDVIDANELNTIRRQFDSLVNYTERAANPARYGVNKRMADAIRETLQQADRTGNLKSIGRELQKLRQLDDIASRQGNLGRGSLPFGLGQTPGAVMGATAGPLGAAVGMASQAAVNSNVGRRALSSGAERVGSYLLNSGARAAGQSPRGIATRIGTAGVGSGILEQNGQSLPNNASMPNTTTPSTNMPMSSSMMDGLYQNNQQMSSPYTLEQALMDIQRDPANADDYMKIYEFVANATAPQSGASSKPMSAEAAKTVTNAQIGLQALSDFENIVANNPGSLQRTVIPGRSVAGGVLGRALGTQSVDAARQQVIDVIARLRTGAAITNDEAARFTQFLPVAADSPDVAAQKIGYLRGQFQDILNRTSSSTPSSLEDALMQYGY